MFIIFAQNNNSAIPSSAKGRTTAVWLIWAEIKENRQRKNKGIVRNMRKTITALLKMQLY